MQEVLTTVRVVKAFGQEDREQDRFLRQSRDTMRARIRLAYAEGGFGLLVNLTTGIGTAAVLYIGARNVQSGVMTLGELIIVMNYLLQLYGPLETISEKVADLQSGLASAERAFALFDESPEVEDRPGGAGWSAAGERSSSATSRSPTKTPVPCCETSPSPSTRAPGWASPGRPAPARRRSSA